MHFNHAQPGAGQTNYVIGGDDIYFQLQVMLRAAALSFILGGGIGFAQGHPPYKEPWSVPTRTQAEQAGAVAGTIETPLQQEHSYSLAELVDLAEVHNPTTKAAWQNARQQGARLRIAQSELLPALTALTIANSEREGVLQDGHFVRDTTGTSESLLQVDYLLLDGGARNGRIREARARLLKANFSFNRVHLNVLFETAMAYYHLLDTLGQRDAAEANLENAETVRRAVEAKLAVGLATKPDAFEAESQRDQARFQVETAKGNVDIAHAGLLTLLGAPPLASLQVEPLPAVDEPVQDSSDIDVKAALDRSLKQRPELGEPLEDRNAAQARYEQARSLYFPQLNFSGNGGEARVFGQQNQLPSMYAGPTELWNATLQLKWDLFDGGRREAQLSEAQAAVRQAEAQIQQTRDEVEQQVVAAFISVRTANAQRKASRTLLQSAKLSYEASLKSYQLGLRSVVDVVTVQRELAQARSTDITARTNLLLQIATFAYRTGDLQKTKIPVISKESP